ncbi:MAG: shikimate kinase [Spirochaetota bacterium]|nr:MAG: shikimate kinase [Spirochaetota bacterium]
MGKEKCLYLIGFMGTGKSSIGSLLAEKLKYIFIDTDSIIEESEGMTINEIFRTKGEASFREMEKRLLKNLTEEYNSKGFVMSTGGGMPCNHENLNYMKQNGKVIYIKSNIDDIIKRVKESEARPIIHRLEKTGDMKEGLEALLKKREYYYMQADITVTNTKGDDADDIVKRIQDQVSE